LILTSVIDISSTGVVPKTILNVLSSGLSFLQANSFSSSSLGNSEGAEYIPGEPLAKLRSIIISFTATAVPEAVPIPSIATASCGLTPKDLRRE